MGIEAPKTTARAAANYIIWSCHKHGDQITNLKLQKLLYFAQGWFLALYGKALFPEPLRAWMRGPVEYGVWKKFSEFRWEAITRKIARPKISELAVRHLDEIMQVYGDYSAYTLERMTHDEGPWRRARGALDDRERSTREISIEDMREHFTRLANEPAQTEEREASN